ncbi:MAG TPA: phosphate ABC transporter substrate-binding protein PstS [Solirubrobacteraceae bacterium]|nr:phosphate ABC transporter substrate-binding protein PstS [Solirubrobacteraceae bacterium]
MRTRRISGVALALTAALAVAACGSSGSSSSSSAAAGGSSSSSSGAAAASGGSVSATINGAGSTLAAPIYQQWASTLKGKGLTINFNPVGSGAGQTDLESATVAFAGSDPSLKPADVKAMKGPVLQFPVAAGAITVSYNLPGVKSGLKLDGPTIADIFSGKITKWDDPAIKSLNPGVSLPGTAITVVHRSDSSGTTEGFTTYLSDVSSAWKSSIGEGKDVKWPVGTGAAKNSGVAAAVKQTQGAVGYVEQAYALENGFTYASVKNSAGTYIAPAIANTSAAFQGVKVPADLGVSTINSPNATAYPIVSQTFLIAYKDPCKDGGLSSTTAKGLFEWLTYAFGPGQATLGAGGNQLPYAPVPSSLLAKNQAQLKTMTCNGAPLS